MARKYGKKPNIQYDGKEMQHTIAYSLSVMGLHFKWNYA